MLYQFSEKPEMIRFQVNIHPHDRFLQIDLSNQRIHPSADP